MHRSLGEGVLRLTARRVVKQAKLPAAIVMTDLSLPSRKATADEGGLAQLARAPALHAGGHRFDSDILHKGTILKDYTNTLEMNFRTNDWKVVCSR